MAVTLVGSKPLTFNTAVTLQRVDGLPTTRYGNFLAITAPAGVDVYVVQDDASADTDALPASYFRIPGNMVYLYPLWGNTDVLLAGSGVGSCTIQVVPGYPG